MNPAQPAIGSVFTHTGGCCGLVAGIPNNFTRPILSPGFCMYASLAQPAPHLTWFSCVPMCVVTRPTCVCQWVLLLRPAWPAPSLGSHADQPELQSSKGITFQILNVVNMNWEVGPGPAFKGWWGGVPEGLAPQKQLEPMGTLCGWTGLPRALEQSWGSSRDQG